MEPLATITDLEATGENLPFPQEFERRTAARAVMTDQQGKVALLFIANEQYHKLPGGGVEEGEDLTAALERELLEETGCRAEIISVIGMVEEYRSRIPLEQISYCYRARVTGAPEQPQFTEEEIAQGASLVWAQSLEEAIRLLENDKPTGWEGCFIRLRDIAFLKAVIN